MQNPERMRGGQGVADPDADAGHLGDGERAVIANQLEQRLRRHQLHDDPRQTILDNHVEDGHHVWMAPQPRGMPGLSQGPFNPVGPLERIKITAEVDLLEGRLGQQHLVKGAPDRAHSAGAEPFDEPVPAGHDAAGLWRNSHGAPSAIFSTPSCPSAACHLDCPVASAASFGSRHRRHHRSRRGGGHPDCAVGRAAQRRMTGPRQRSS